MHSKPVSKISTALGSDVVLGPPSSICYMRTGSGLPIERAITRQKLRPGSGCLSVRVATDGPTRVLQITDVKQKVNIGYILI